MNAINMQESWTRWPSKAWRNAWSLVALALLCAVFYWDMLWLSAGRIVAGNNMSDMFFPWLCFAVSTIRQASPVELSFLFRLIFRSQIFIGRSLDLAVAGQAYLLLVTLITLGSIVPTLPGQIGTTEFLIVGGLAVFAVDKEPALTFAILLRLVRLLPLGLGYVALLRAGLRLSDIKAVRQNNLSVSG